MDDKGVKTSEFWGKNLVQGLMVLGAVTHHGVTEQQAMAVVAGLEMAYMGLRTIRKAVADLASAVKTWKAGQLPIT